jgi:energy-coupling factor transport system substrate-specific component
VTNTADARTTTSGGPAAAPSRFRWRVVDIIVTAVIAVACGVIFVGWNFGSEIFKPLSAVLPGLQALNYGIWLLAGPLAALIVRKPGAALFAELVAAAVSMMLGASWGLQVLESGLVQGLATEIVFLAFLYKVWTLPVAMLSGAAAGLAAGLNDLVFWYSAADGLFKTVYVAAAVVSGAVLAGLLAWLLTKALARTGALNRFASGRELAERV